MRFVIQHILRWSERYAKTDMVYLGRSGFWLGLGQVAGSLSALVISVAFANLLPPATYGTYKFVLSFAAIIAIPTLNGLNTALVRAIAQRHDGTIRATARLKLRGGFIAFLLGVGVAAYYFAAGNATLAIAFFIVSAGIPFMELGGLYSAILTGKYAFSRLARYDICLYAAVTVGLCAAAYLGGNLFVILATYFGLWTIGRLLALYRITRITRADETHTVSAESLSLGKHLSAINVLGTLASNLDRIMLFHLLGPVSVAVYSIAIAPVYQAKGLAKLVNPLALPKFSEHVAGMAVRDYLRKLLLFTIAASGIALLYFLLAPFLFKILFPQYAEAVFYTRTLSVAIAFSGYALNTAILVAYNAKRQLYIQVIVFSTVEIALMLIGAYGWGVLGVAVAFSIGQLLYFIGSTAQVLFILSKNPSRITFTELKEKTGV